MHRMGMSWYRMGFLLLCLIVVGACSPREELPTPRSVIIFSGVRLQADAEKMEEVDQWLRDQLQDIERNPGFLIELHRGEREVRPWETLHIEGDTARISMERVAPDAETPFLLYAHYRLMAERDELEQWLPEAPEARGFELERAILNRIADAWFLGRSIYDTHAYAPLDELLYSREFGYLNAYILVAQNDRFAEEREEWIDENPEEVEEFLAWFRRTFERDPPGWTENATPRRGSGGGFIPLGWRPSTGD